MASSFKPNSAAFRQMATGPEITAAVTAEAKRAKAIARGLAQDFEVSGEYESAFVVTTETVRLNTAFGEHDVAAGMLTNVAVDEKGHAYAAAVEWGDKHDHRAHHVLGRTLAGMSDD